MKPKFWINCIPAYWDCCDRYVFTEQDGCGIAILDVGKNNPPKGTAYLYNLRVSPHCRREGLATELLTRAEKVAEQQGCRRITLEWDIKDSPLWVLDWYVRRGYVELEFTPMKSALLAKPLKPATQKGVAK